LFFLSFDVNSLKYDRDGLIPAIVQDSATGEVLMMAYMNPESVQRTLETGETWFWSRSRQKYWHKGESSGNVQRVTEITYDCDRDTLLLKVEQKGAACHEGYFTCFHNRICKSGAVEIIGERFFDPEEVYGKDKGEVKPAVSPAEDGVPGGAPAEAGILNELYAVITDRIIAPPENSYTAELLAGGKDRILKKVAEEAAEVIIAAKNGEQREIVAESTDLLYHLLVLLASQGIGMDKIYNELASRRK
jgi:phosphoribosyl-ATP pyrophosphohydrolase/phosphoribosyl-AMP cyclohydrolase